MKYHFNSFHIYLILSTINLLYSKNTLFYVIFKKYQHEILYYIDYIFIIFDKMFVAHYKLK